MTRAEWAALIVAVAALIVAGASIPPGSHRRPILIIAGGLALVAVLIGVGVNLTLLGYWQEANNSDGLSPSAVEEDDYCRGIDSHGAPETSAEVARLIGGTPDHWVKDVPNHHVCSNAWIYYGGGNDYLSFTVPAGCVVHELAWPPYEHKSGERIRVSDFIIYWVG